VHLRQYRVLQNILHDSMGRNSSVDMATRYGLDGPGIESRWGREFPHPFTPAHTTSYTMGTGSFQGVKQPGRGVDHTPPSSAEVRERVELYLYSTSGLVSCYRVNFNFLPLPLLHDSFSHLAVCLTTGPKPLPKRALHIVRSGASSFKREYPLLSLRSSNSFLRLLPCLPVTSIPLVSFLQ